MKDNKMKSIFGKFNLIIDELIHLLLSSIISLIGFIMGLSIFETVICFILAILIDIDHIFNPIIAKCTGIKAYGNKIVYGFDGYVIKIFHGFDISLIICIAAYFFYGNLLFSMILYLNLCLHEFWDFSVYKHSWKELFLLTRIINRFKPGERDTYVGYFFEIDTLNY